MTSLPIAVGYGHDGSLPSDLRSAWYIARRAALESLRDPMTVGISATWSLVVPYFIVLFLVHPQTSQFGFAPVGSLGEVIATFILLVGLMPASGSLGIAAGLFAGEKEHGTLLPLLATPASNRAIFGGKVLGAVLPALLYAALAEIGYFAEVSLLLGAETLRQLPLAFAFAMLALVPIEAVLGAALASLISSRVRTYQSAQMLASLVLYPVMAAILGAASHLQRWPALPLLGVVVAMAVGDLLLVVLSAATWRREEVLARR
ncbi:MAG TPA: ABC transporter permease subunit [Chloroflexota bacterium]|nr:ABC transporter permease subunit [Chloroflexota bacterium]